MTKLHVKNYLFELHYCMYIEYIRVYKIELYYYIKLNIHYVYILDYIHDIFVH